MSKKKRTKKNQKLIDEADNLAVAIRAIKDGQLSFLKKDAETVNNNTCAEVLKQISK